MSSEVPQGVSIVNQQNESQPLLTKISRRVRSLFVYLAYLIGILVLVVIAFMEHKAPQPGETEAERPEFWSTDFWYEWVVGAADPRDVHVAVITIGKDMPKHFPLTTDATSQDGPQAVGGRGKTSEAEKSEAPVLLPEPCRRRLYIGELLKALPRRYPKVVVLDISLDPELCSDKQVNDSLSKELREFSEYAPVILGVASRSSVDLQAESPAEFRYMMNRAIPFKPTELVLMPVAHLVAPTGGRITEALIRRDSNTRRIPLSWPVYDDFPEVGSGVQPKRQDTLSVAAVRAFDPHHSVLKRIDALDRDGSPKVSADPHPYTSFVKENEIPIGRAIDVICSSSLDEAWKTICLGTRGFGFTPDSLKDKIVVIGIVGLGDVHPTVLGKVPGVILQANYIQSLLNNRVYKPLPLSVDLIIVALWLGGVFAIAWGFRRNPVLALALSVLATILVAYVILKFLTLEWVGYYTSLVIPLAAAAVVTNLTVQFHHFLLHQGGTPS